MLTYEVFSVSNICPALDICFATRMQNNHDVHFIDDGSEAQREYVYLTLIPKIVLFYLMVFSTVSLGTMLIGPCSSRKARKYRQSYNLGLKPSHQISRVKCTKLYATKRQRVRVKKNNDKQKI